MIGPIVRRKLRSRFLLTIGFIGSSVIAAPPNLQAASEPYHNYLAENIWPVSGYDQAWWTPFASAPSVLGWRFGVDLQDFGTNMSDALFAASNINVANYVGNGNQRVSWQISRPLGPSLFTGERRTIPWMLNSTSMVAYRISAMPSDLNEEQDIFEFARTQKVETILVDKTPGKLFQTAALAQSYGIDVAICAGSADRQVAFKAVRDSLSGSYGNASWHLKATEGSQSNRTERVNPYLNRGEENSKSHGRIGLCLTKDDASLGMSELDNIVTEFGDRVFYVELPAGQRPGECQNACVLSLLYKRKTYPTLIVIRGSGPDHVVEEVKRAVADLDNALRPLIADQALKRSKLSNGASTDAPSPVVAHIPSGMTPGNAENWDPVTPEARAAIASAIPKSAPVAPHKPRKLLVMDLNLAYPGHTSIPIHNYALKLMGEVTGAYQAIFDNDLDNLKWPAIKKYDAIFLNNTVGLIFSDPAVREGLIKFVKEGGGLAGIHAATHASLDWPEFSQMIGAYPASHQEPTEQVWLKIDDPDSPLMKSFAGQEYLHQDEYFRFFPPYDRHDLHVLLSIDTKRTDMSQYIMPGPPTPGLPPMMPAGRYVDKYNVDYLGREDSDYAVSWIKSYGKGRVFYTTMGHSPTLFSDPKLASHMLAGIQYVLGDLEADSTPNPIH